MFACTQPGDATPVHPRTGVWLSGIEGASRGGSALSFSGPLMKRSQGTENVKSRRNLLSG